MNNGQASTLAAHNILLDLKRLIKREMTNADPDSGPILSNFEIESQLWAALISGGTIIEVTLTRVHWINVCEFGPDLNINSNLTLIFK